MLRNIRWHDLEEDDTTFPTNPATLLSGPPCGSSRRSAGLSFPVWETGTALRPCSGARRKKARAKGGQGGPRLPGDTHVSELDQALLAQGAEALVGRARLQEELRQAHSLAPEQRPHGGQPAPRGARRTAATPGSAGRTVSRGGPDLGLLLRPGRGPAPWGSGLQRPPPSGHRGRLSSSLHSRAKPRPRLQPVPVPPPARPLARPTNGAWSCANGGGGGDKPRRPEGEARLPAFCRTREKTVARPAV